MADDTLQSIPEDPLQSPTGNAPAPLPAQPMPTAEPSVTPQPATPIIEPATPTPTPAQPAPTVQPETIPANPTPAVTISPTPVTQPAATPAPTMNQPTQIPIVPSIEPTTQPTIQTPQPATQQPLETTPAPQPAQPPEELQPLEEKPKNFIKLFGIPLIIITLIGIIGYYLYATIFSGNKAEIVESPNVQDTITPTGITTEEKPTTEETVETPPAETPAETPENTGVTRVTR